MTFGDLILVLSLIVTVPMLIVTQIIAVYIVLRRLTSGDRYTWRDFAFDTACIQAAIGMWALYQIGQSYLEVTALLMGYLALYACRNSHEHGSIGRLNSLKT